MWYLQISKQLTQVRECGISMYLVINTTNQVPQRGWYLHDLPRYLSVVSKYLLTQVPCLSVLSIYTTYPGTLLVCVKYLRLLPRYIISVVSKYLHNLP